MKLNTARTLIAGLFAAAIVVGGLGSSAADAQVRRPGRVVIVRPFDPFWHRRYDPFWCPYYNRTVVVDPVGVQRENGYHDGREEGEKDAKNDRPADPTSEKDYYKSKSIAYREAFVQGYNEGYRDRVR